MYLNSKLAGNTTFSSQLLSLHEDLRFSQEKQPCMNISVFHLFPDMSVWFLNLEEKEASHLCFHHRLSPHISSVSLPHVLWMLQNLCQWEEKGQLMPEQPLLLKAENHHKSQSHRVACWKEPPKVIKSISWMWHWLHKVVLFTLFVRNYQRFIPLILWSIACVYGPTSHFCPSGTLTTLKWSFLSLVLY